MAAFPRAVVPFEVTALEMPGPLISKAQSGRVNFRSTQQIGRTWTEHYLVNTRSVNGRALLAFVDNVWRNGTTFTIDHRDHVTPLGTGGGAPLINQPPQLVTDPENFGAWTLVAGTVTRTSGQTDPFGGVAAYLLEDDAAGAAEAISENITFTADATKAFAIYLKAGTATSTNFRIVDVTAGSAIRIQINIAWSGGVPTPTVGSGSGVVFTVESSGGSWYRIGFTANSVVAANTNRWEIYPASTTAAGVGTIYAFGANAWNSATPAGYIGPSHLTATGDRVYLDGATASVTNWLRAGDILSVGGLAPTYEVTADTNSEAGGYVSVPINPPIFTGGAPADNAAVTITGVTLTACILEPPTYPTTSGTSADWGELTIRFSESL